jgi:hypothetical protein
MWVPVSAGVATLAEMIEHGVELCGPRHGRVAISAVIAGVRYTQDRLPCRQTEHRAATGPARSGVSFCAQLRRPCRTREGLPAAEDAQAGRRYSALHCASKVSIQI